LVVLGVLYFATHTLQLVVSLINSKFAERQRHKQQEEAQRAAVQAQRAAKVGGRR